MWIQITTEYDKPISRQHFLKTLGKEGLEIGDFDIPGDVCLDEERRVVVTEFWNSGRQVMSRVWKKGKMDNLTTRVVCL